MKNYAIRWLWPILAAAFFGLSAFNASAQACLKNERQTQLSLTLPVMVQLPMNANKAPIGSVLYRKEDSLATLTGNHKTVEPACINEIKSRLVGRINTAPGGLNTFVTSVQGIGVRFTVIYAKPGESRQEWILPFTTTLNKTIEKALTTDDIRVRIEIIKMGDINQTGNQDFRVPSLISLDDNKLTVNLLMKIMAVKAHCSVQVTQPQITLPPIDAQQLIEKGSDAFPVGVSLQCINTQQASINVEGVSDTDKPGVFKNIAVDKAAKGVGIEMLYNGVVMVPFVAQNIILSKQVGIFSLPLTTRYAKTGQKIVGGDLKTQITLRVNYL